MATSTARKTPPTKRAGHRAIFGGRTTAERAAARKGVNLRDSGITSRTKSRYLTALQVLLPLVTSISSLLDLDPICEEWIEYKWASGATLGSIGDALCGLQFYWPETKGYLRSSWKLYKNWRRIEIPNRAPPISAIIVRAFVSWLVDQEHVCSAFLFALGFHAYLRTGELLSLRFKDLQLGTRTGIVTIRGGKSGLRNNIDEAVALYDPLVVQLGQLAALLPHNNNPQSPVWPWSAAALRHSFRRCVEHFNLQNLNYKPYSLRRGGATHDYVEKGLLDPILLRGRWHSLAVARLYLEDGLAQLPSLTLPGSTLRQIRRAASPYTSMF